MNINYLGIIEMLCPLLIPNHKKSHFFPFFFIKMAFELKFWKNWPHLGYIFCFLPFSVVSLLPGYLNAQIPGSYLNNPDKNQWIEDIDHGPFAEDYSSLTDFEDQLDALSRDPIDLNKGNLEILSVLGLIGAHSIYRIQEYRRVYGAFVSVYELQAVPGISIKEIKKILPYIRISTQLMSLNNAHISGKSTLYFKWKRKIQQPAGILDNKFLGDNNHLFIRLRHASRPGIRWGLVAEKDPGEPYFNKNTLSLPDYLSGYMEINRRIKLFDGIILGDYNLSFGQGLIVSNLFGLGKSALVTRVKKHPVQIRAHTSSEETLFFRGSAVKLNLSGQLKGVLFISSRNKDANRNMDNDLGVPVFTSLGTSGLHRTTAELEDQDAIKVTTAGVRISFEGKSNSYIGINALYQGYSIPFMPRQTPYNRFLKVGKRFLNASIDYGYNVGSNHLFGELALDESGNMAFLSGVMTTLDPRFDLIVLHRHYGKAYYAPNANGFSERARTNDEAGLYTGLVLRMGSNWSIKAYTDIWHTDWIGFRRNAAERGYETLAKIEWSRKKHSSLYLLFALKGKQENHQRQEGVPSVVPVLKQKIRIHFIRDLNRYLSLRSRIELGHYSKVAEKSTGYLVYQGAVIKGRDFPYLNLNVRLTYFSIQDYSSRIYAFENDLSGEFAVPFYYGHGIRGYVKLRLRPARTVKFEIKAAHTHYFNRDHSGSGLLQINGPDVTQVKCQLIIDL